MITKICQCSVMSTSKKVSYFTKLAGFKAFVQVLQKEEERVRLKAIIAKAKLQKLLNQRW